MTVTYSLAPNPKWYIADLVGIPLGGGYLSTFSNLDKSIQKLVYQDIGGQFPWPYVPVPNTDTTGILFDENGAQGPFYFEFDSTIPQSLYYLEVYDSDGVLQWTIDNFSPGGNGGGAVVTSIIDVENLVVNNVMYRNIGASANPIAATYLPIAPGSHEGFARTSSNCGPDIVFVKNNTNASDTLTFMPFTLGSGALTGDVTPTEFLRYVCSNTPSGETIKCVQFPITSQVQNLSNQNVTVTIWAKGNSGTQLLTLQVLQFFGDGAGASSSVTTPIQILSLSNGWVKYSAQFTVPSVTGKTLGGCHNDGLFLQVWYPLGASCSIDFTKPAMYVGNVAPTEDYQTYDVIGAITNSPRTADVRTSYNYSGNNYVPGGWVYMNDGSIGNPSSNAITRANFDTFPLFNLLWDINDIYCPMLDSTGTPTGRGATAIADFTANRQLAIPKALGRVLSGADPTGINFLKYFTVVSLPSSTLVVNDTGGFYTGTPVTLQTTGSLPSPLLVGTTYYLIIISQTGFQVASSLSNAVNFLGITLTSTGSGLNTLTASLPAHPLGSYVGEETHSQSINELVSHAHTLAGFTGLKVDAGGPAGSLNVGTAVAEVTNPNGFNVPFNILQPTTYANYIIKL